MKIHLITIIRYDSKLIVLFEDSAGAVFFAIVIFVTESLVWQKIRHWQCFLDWSSKHVLPNAFTGINDFTA